jgi:hypothetical protein
MTTIDRPIFHYLVRGSVARTVAMLALTAPSTTTARTINKGVMATSLMRAPVVQMNPT